ncbi:unnamed protein product [Rotaria socialis]|uniref:Uncharacterized protein n=1 Tax=Rotaria socialis TaxID=392032 RepID=A0A818TTQ7_9BILA|nr:unnamed protein product [Rotaria socialis]CAF3342627.1 unnamed protein product [Rotaria socialis]CAF3593285.1 unnamed protein product [Rotaria socialis]CAF3688887.1 unnamed protein product [Rotaria socialis]CAF4222827.1 unnamed protein product [Rotaria socialis]
MAYFGPSPQFLAEYTARNAEIEQKLTNEQLQYVRQRYRMNKYASPMEIRQIVTQLDIDDSEFYIDLTEWFFYRRSMEYENEQYRYQLARIAA